MVNDPKIKTCVGCGYFFTNELGFCPSCGRMVSDERGPIKLFSHGNEAGKKQEPERSRPTQSCQYEPWRSQDQYPSPYPNPYYQNQYPRQEFPVPRTPNPGHGSNRYQQSWIPNVKDPKMAMVLAGFGFLGFMGIGHFYMGKFVRGIILLLVGGFLALLSLESIFLIFQPSEFSVWVRIITAVIFTMPFLLVLLWQLFDAPKPVRWGKVEDP